MIFNQFVFSANALNICKLDLINPKKDTIHKKNNDEIDIVNVNVYETDDYEKSLRKESEELEKFVDETFSPNNGDNFIEQNDKFLNEISNTKLSEEELNNKEVDYQLIIQQKEDDYIKHKSKKQKTNKKNKKDILNNLPLPSRSIISTKEFTFPSRGYVKLTGPKTTINFQGVDAIEALKLIGKLGNYGIVIIDGNDQGKEISSETSKITANFNDADISDVFNSILLSSDLQAVLEKKIIFIGKNILTKS